MMKITEKSLFAVVMLALVGLMGSSAMADSVTATFNTVNPSRSFSYTLNGSDSSTVAGVMNWTKVSGSDTIDAAFSTFCIEITQHVNYGGTYTYDLVSPEVAPNTLPMGETKADYLSELWGRYESSVLTGTTTDMQTKAAAFQIAVWEIVYDNDLDVLSASGSFHARGSLTAWSSLAQTWLSSLTLDPAYMANLVALTNVSHQDQLTWGGPTTTTVPLPAGVWMGMSLLGGMGLMRRIRGVKA